MADGVSDIIRSYETRIPVEFSHFALFDFLEHSSTRHLHQLNESDWIGQSGEGGAIFHADDTSLEARVLVQLRSGEPTAEEMDSEYSYRGEFSSGSGELLLAAATGSSRDLKIPLMGAGQYKIFAARSPGRIETSLGDSGQCERWEILIWQ
ncbi:hypothetical protein M8C13_09040 [Crossiella sp. SN42]|uniref:hypothetical protein n=1 Tax=Crossiella sp. SN42 TaxID=2944808 RepID=UPI00207CC06D|nr:hypothetical protein [Crossiella sp. SN42]MCO1575901.1 hypothetical protein [Crossiella sp. SN42]